MYFYSLGDKFHVQYDTRKGKRRKIFTLKEIVEVVPGRIYKILFETDEGERVIRQYERKFPREFDLVQNINR
ncbi:MAG: hypothetical protein E3J72_22145 [Planctomycetota bacterium]|nr:MAG: hypothetical protein E3J72_22145 [Planctomycetota bacterium]